MMDYGLSDAEERAVFGSDDEPECEWSDEDEADRLIKEIKEEGNWPWWK
jgi:hypothetical protein